MMCILPQKRMFIMSLLIIKKCKCEGKIGFTQIFTLISSNLHIKPPVLHQFMSYIRCTLRSWVYEIFWHSRTISPWVGDNCVSKCSSDRIPHTKYMSSCVENSQNHTLMFCCSLILGRRFEKHGNYGKDLSYSSSPFHDLLPTIGDQRCIVM